MASLNIPKAAASGIMGASNIKSATNAEYIIASKETDKRIERNNKMYSEAYKRASHCLVK